MRASYFKQRHKSFFMVMASIALTSLPAFLYGVGIRTPTGEIKITEVGIGESYSLIELSRKPYRVINTSEEPFDVTVSVNKPHPVRKGYEEIPEISWVRLSQAQFQLGPGQEGVSDVLVSLPNDTTLLGRRFAVELEARTVPHEGGGMAVSAGVASTVLIHVSKQALTEKQKERAKELKAMVSFDFSPTILEISNFPKGEEVDIKKFTKKAIKIINPNDEIIEVSVTAIPLRLSLIPLPPQFEEGQANWVHIKGERFKLGDNSIKEVSISIKIPKETKPHKFAFVIQATLEGREVPVNIYGRIAITTK